MEQFDLVSALYELKGSVDSAKENNNDKFATIFQKLDKITEKQNDHEQRLNNIEINWKWIARISGGVAALTSLVITPLLTVFIDMLMKGQKG